MGKMNQGLQIALILFVIIAIVLGVTTFLFKKQADEAIVQKDAAVKELASVQMQLTQSKDEVTELKQLIGYADIPLTEIRDKFDKAMQLAAPGAEKPTYVSVTESFVEQNKGLNDQVAQLKKDMEALAAKYKTREESKEKIIAEANEKARKAIEEKEKLETQQKSLLAEKDDNLKKTFVNIEKKVKDLTKEKAAQVKKYEESQDLLARQRKDYADLQGKLEETSRPPQDNPQGEIIYINPRGTMGLINLGKADGLTRGLTFSVYDPKNMSELGLKGSIEVISVEGNRQAEVNIENKSESSPIEVGDVIYTPVWAPGFQEHFALIGHMDIRGEGRNDLEVIKSLITRNGGVIDAYMKEDGSQEGKITTRTTWLVVGTESNDVSPEEELITRTNMEKEAEKYNVKKIALAELLRKMGYRPPVQERTTSLMDVNGAPRQTSSGSVANRYYQEESTSRRQPPRGSAY